MGTSLFVEEMYEEGYNTVEKTHKNSESLSCADWFFCFEEIPESQKDESLHGGCYPELMIPAPSSNVTFPDCAVRPRSLLDVNKQGEQRLDGNEVLFPGTGII